MSATMWRCRTAALSVRGAGHGRAGVSRAWRELGVSSVASSKSRALCVIVNPTLFDLVTPSAPIPAANASASASAMGKAQKEKGKGRKKKKEPQKAERFPFSFLEDQGPSGAFACLRGLRAGSREFRSCFVYSPFPHR